MFRWRRFGAEAARRGILPPVAEAAQNRWVLINYAVAIIGLLLIGGVWQIQRRAEQPIELIPPEGERESGAAADRISGGDA